MKRRILGRILGGIVALALFLPCEPLLAATIFDVEKVLAAPPTATDKGAVAVLQDGGVLQHVKYDSLRMLSDAHKRIGTVAKVSANLALVIDRMPNAFAIPIRGRNVILVTTGMLELVGTDADMIASMVGHEYAHLSMRHSLSKVMNLPDFVYGAVAVAESVNQSTGDRKSAISAGRQAFGLMTASFSREQEVEADRVGTELMSSAKYNPEGTVRLMQAMLKMFGSKPTGYFDSHPGFEDRIAKAEPTVLNQRFDTVAVTLAEQKNWKMLARITDHWIKVSPDSARAWYYRGATLAATKRDGSLEAFQKAVGFDPDFEPGRLALCVALHTGGRELESLICAEHLARGGPLEEYQAQTNQANVYVSGMNPGRKITALDVMIVQQVMGARK